MYVNMQLWPEACAWAFGSSRVPCHRPLPARRELHLQPIASAIQRVEQRLEGNVILHKLAKLEDERYRPQPSKETQ